MPAKTVGFVGSGRVARVILGGFKRSGCMPAAVVASDTNQEVLERLKIEFPAVRPALNNNPDAAGQDIVFLALHPPAMPAALAEIKNGLKPGATVISLAPKLSIARISELLGGFGRIVRLIPNAASIIGRGYNPIAFSPSVGGKDKEEIHSLMKPLGKCPEVTEEKLDAYAVVVAMGPTYLWFQLHELRTLAESFGMTSEEAVIALTEMAEGAARTLFGSGMTAEQVIDLIPVKPLGEDEAAIRAAYRTRLEPLYRKLRG